VVSAADQRPSPVGAFGRWLGFVGAEHGRAESLNLAAAATVCLYASATAQGR
jgi:hypothetical protein